MTDIAGMDGKRLLIVQDDFYTVEEMMEDFTADSEDALALIDSGAAIDGRTTRHKGYAVSLRIRKRIEEGYGWMKSVAGLDRPMLRGRARIGWAFTFATAAYNLVRLPKLLAALP